VSQNWYWSKKLRRSLCFVLLLLTSRALSNEQFNNSLPSLQVEIFLYTGKGLKNAHLPVEFGGIPVRARIYKGK